MKPSEGYAPKGTLVAVGGNEDKQFDLKVLRRICDLPEGGTQTVEILPTASSIPQQVSEQYIKVFSKIGVKETRVMNIDSRQDARDPELVDRIRKADVVFMTGGDQLRLTNLLGGSPVHSALRGHYERGGVVAGTSAGAAAMSTTMIFEGEAGEALHKGTVRMTPGLGFIDCAVIDTHFIHRGRFSRLLEVVTSNPGHIGLGLSEDTGIIIRDGHLVEAFGTGVAVVLDGHHIAYSNIAHVEMGKAIAVENITVHTLAENHRFDLNTHAYIAPKERPEGKNEDP